MSSTPIVLITGASGYVATAVVLAFIEQTNYNIRGTVRSQAKGDAWLAKHPVGKGRVSWAIVPDIAAPGAFDEAVKGCIGESASIH